MRKTFDKGNNITIYKFLMSKIFNLINRLRNIAVSNAYKMYSDAIMDKL